MPSKMKTNILLAILFLFSFSLSAIADVAPHYIFYNGNVLTVNADFRQAEAFAVSGERIVAVGSNAEIFALAGNTTQRINLHGKTVMPGIIDSHSHPVPAAM
jgi:predicted amidohydrolase YtcJ